MKIVVHYNSRDSAESLAAVLNAVEHAKAGLGFDVETIVNAQNQQSRGKQ